MHHLRLVLIAAAVCSAAYGCATDDQPAASGAHSQPSHNSGTYRTGSRLPTYDSQGSSSTGAQSKDEFMDERNRNMGPGERMK